jgi:hypothetical protein
VARARDIVRDRVSVWYVWYFFIQCLYVARVRDRVRDSVSVWHVLVCARPITYNSLVWDMREQDPKNNGTV